MANLAFTRVQRECKEVVTSKEVEDTGILIEIQNDQLTSLKGIIRGPPDSPYENGLFTLDVHIPSGYPFQPPKVKFITRIWHPNVSSQTGLICLDILKEQWAASLTLRTVLLSIQALLAAPEPKDPQDAVVANQMMNNPALFERTARFWTAHFATPTAGIGHLKKDPELDAKVHKIMEMGVSEDRAVNTLSCCGWDLTKATDDLFT